MSDTLFLAEPLLDHVREYIVFYGLGVPLAVLCIYLTRPYSVSMILYGIEIAIYIGLMHTAMHVCVNALTWLSHETRFQAVDTRQEAVDWTTPWLRFWEWDQYNPEWLVWLEAALVLLIIMLVRRYRPMKVQRKQKISVKAAGPQKKKGAVDDDDDGWGVSTRRQYEIPENFGPNKKK